VIAQMTLWKEPAKYSDAFEPGWLSGIFVKRLTSIPAVNWTIKPMTIRGRRVGPRPPRSSKAAENAGGADRRLRSAYEIGQLAVTDHARSMMATAWALGGLPQFEHLRLRAWAHMLGFRGHFLTKARRYSVTFGALRTVRVRFRTKLALIARALAGEPVFDPDSTIVIGGFSFAGVGMPNLWRVAAAAEGSAP
jgi:hypothetical protein